MRPCNVRYTAGILTGIGIGSLAYSAAFTVNSELRLQEPIVWMAGSAVMTVIGAILSFKFRQVNHTKVTEYTRHAKRSKDD